MNIKGIAIAGNGFIAMDGSVVLISRDADIFEATLNTTPIKKPEPAKKPDFEKSLGRLEEVVRRGSYLRCRQLFHAITWHEAQNVRCMVVW